jgi:hypothetical protein
MDFLVFSVLQYKAAEILHKAIMQEGCEFKMELYALDADVCC